MDSTESVRFHDFLSFTLEGTATPMSQGLEVLQKYLNAMPIVSYDSNDKRRLRERKYAGRRERAVGKANRFSNPGAKNPPALWSLSVPV